MASDTEFEQLVRLKMIQMMEAAGMHTAHLTPGSPDGKAGIIAAMTLASVGEWQVTAAPFPKKQREGVLRDMRTLARALAEEFKAKMAAKRGTPPPAHNVS